jgi:glycosyltransferase involved in cell wall biosynthesis
MQPERFTFVMEQTLGHIPFAQNLRKAFDSDKSVEVSWLKVDYSQQSWFEKLPLVRHNWSLRGSLKARQAVRSLNKATGKPALYLFHTQVISLLSAGWLPGNIPLIVSLDATPLNYDRVGQAYGHQTGNQLIEKIKFWLNRRAFHKATYLVTWSEWARQSLIQDYGVPPDKVEVIAPGTDLDFWGKAAAKRPAQKQEKLALLFVGGDFERKGGRLLYEVFRKSLSGSYELHLVTKAPVEAGEGIFVYHNLQPNSPALQELFSRADVFVLPTEGDCLPVAITEAMAASLPVVSTRVGAIEEAVTDGENGFLIAPGDGPALTQALARLADDPELRRAMGKKSRGKAEKYFDASKNGGHLLEICKKLARC